MLTIIEQVIKDNNVRYTHIMTANSNSTQQKWHLIQPFESNGTLEKWQKGISKPFLLSNISPRGVSPPSYKITCSIVGNAWFILLFAQASIKVRNNTSIRSWLVVLQKTNNDDKRREVVRRKITHNKLMGWPYGCKTRDVKPHVLEKNKLV